MIDPAGLLSALEACAIGNECFGHAQHVAAAWEALRQEPFQAAAARICAALRRFAAHCGQAQRYDEELTLGFLRLIADRQSRLPAGASWSEFQATFPELFDRASAAVRAVYEGRRKAS